MVQSEKEYIDKAIMTAKQSMSTAKIMLPSLNHDAIEEVIDLAIATLVGIKLLTKAIDPVYGQTLYCRGMIFGLEGSKILVQIANIIHKNQVKWDARKKDKDGNFVEEEDTGLFGAFGKLTHDLYLLGKGEKEEL